MTYIEFFDHDPLLNLAACLAKTPARVVFIGNDRKEMERHAVRYRALLASRGEELDVVCKSINLSDLAALTAALEELVESDECVVDLTGGSELCTLAMGMVLAGHPGGKIHLRRFLPAKSQIQEFAPDGSRNVVGKVSLTVEEAIMLRGGRIVYAEEKSDATYRWEVTPEFEKQVDLLWDYCRRDPSEWNKSVSGLKRYEARGIPVSPTVTPIDRGELPVPKGAFWDYLDKTGLLRVEQDADGMTLRYASPQVKRALNQEGQLLELVIYLALVKAGGEDCMPVDVLTGVSLLWDNQEDPFDTENEVDVLAVRGAVPLFISCKNGRVEVDELYKLSTVVERFGGDLGRAVLVASELPDDGRFARRFRGRADDMGIRILDDLDERNPDELPDLLASLWRA